MAATFFDSGLVAFIQGDVDMLVDDIKVVALNSGYTFDRTHDFLSDITGGGSNVVVTSGNLASKTVTQVNNKAVFDAADVAFGNVNNGTVTQYVIYKDTGVAGTSQLILHVDGYSQATNGGPLNLAWADTENKIFAVASA